MTHTGPAEDPAAMYDEYRVDFADGTSTLIAVAQEEDIQAAVVDLCDRHGWNADDVTRIQLTQIGIEP